MSRPDETPVLIEIEVDDLGESPEEAPAIGVEGLPAGRAMQVASSYAGGRSSGVGRWFLRLLVALLGFLLSVSIWDMIVGLMDRSPILGGIGIALAVLLLLVSLVLVLSEISALVRLRKTSGLRAEAEAALAEDDLARARRFTGQLQRFYEGREELRWSQNGLDQAENFEVSTELAVSERTLLQPLDRVAEREIESAARQVAVVTALVPMALADVAVALLANLRMIRRIAEIYGGRSGMFGSWRLARSVMAHLVATGAMSVGEDLLGSVGGGHLLGKISRRFGEGLVNGALTTRVGIAAIEICRPMPFVQAERPKTGRLVRNALAGMVDREKAEFNT